MIRQLLSVVDLVAGILLILHPGISLVRLVGLFVLGKGVWSIITSAMLGYFTDWMGMIDTLAGVALIWVYNGHSFPLTLLLGLFIIFKGLFSMF